MSGSGSGAAGVSEVKRSKEGKVEWCELLFVAGAVLGLLFVTVEVAPSREGVKLVPAWLLLSSDFLKRICGGCAELVLVRRVR